MSLSARANEVIELPPEEFPQVAVNAMVSLQYRSELFDEAFGKLVFGDDTVESYGSESWRCKYQATLSWKELDGRVELEVKVKEKNYGDTHIESCVERAQRIVEEIVRTAQSARDKKELDVPWRAKFASEAELLDSGFVIEPGASAKELSQSLLVGKFEEKKLWLTKSMKDRHVIVCGPTGCGKSTAIFIPNLIERVESSAIVTEASPGSKMPVLYGATAGWRAKCGQRVLYFNPDDPRTMRINPVDLVKTYDDAQMIAGLIVTNTTADSHMGDQVWGQAETHLLQALLMHAAGMRAAIDKPSVKGDGANLGAIRRLLRKGPKGMEAEFAVTRSAIAKSEYEAFLNNSSPNFRFGVVSGLLARLALFANPKIAAATEVTDFSLDELVNQRFTMYLAVPVHRSDYLPLSALAFNFIFTFAMSKLEELKYPLNLYLDEFTNYGAIPGIARYLTVIRNAGVGAVLGVQDLAQLEYVYKDKLAQIIWSQPRTKVLFPPADDRMAERISKMLGTETQQEIVSASGHLSNRQFPRPLIDAAELLKLEKEGKYLVVSNTNPVKVSRMKSWEDYPSTTRLPVPLIEELKVDDCQDGDSPQTASPQKPEETPRERSCQDVGADTEEAKANGGQSDVLEEEVSGVEPIPSGEEPSFATESPEGASPIEDKREGPGDPAGGPEGRDGDEGAEGDFWSNLRGKYK